MVQSKHIVPFEGAVEIVKEQRNKIIKRGKIKCSCGMLEFFFTEHPGYHLEDCIIHNKGKKKKKRRKRR